MVEIFASLYVIARFIAICRIDNTGMELSRNRDKIQGMNFNYIRLIPVFFIQVLLFVYLQNKEPMNNIVYYLIGPMLIVSWVDAENRYIYDIDIWFLLIIKIIVLFLSSMEYILLYVGEDNLYILNTIMRGVLPSLMIFIITLTLSKIKGVIGEADPYLYFSISLTLGWYDTIYIFFLSYILAGLYVVTNYFLFGEVEDKLALGPFICTAFLII